MDFRICIMFLGCPCEELNKRHNIRLTPTGILIVIGQERKHWVAEYDANAYHAVLNEVVGGARLQESKGSAPVAKQGDGPLRSGLQALRFR